MRRLPLLLLLAALGARAEPAPTAALKGQRVDLPFATAPGGRHTPGNLLISAQREILLATLSFRGWTVAPTTEAMKLDGQPPELELEASSSTGIDQRYTLRLWRRPAVVQQAPLWLGLATVEQGVKPLQPSPPSLEPSPQALNRVLADLSYGVSQTRQAARSGGGPGRIAWVELHFAPEEAEHLTLPQPSAAPGPTPSVALRPLPQPTPAPEALITRVAGAGKRVALTFDACSTLDHSRYDAKVIEILRREQVPATLFISGRWAETHVQEVQELAKDPRFEIANHSYIHPHMTEMPASRQKEELLWTQEILYSLTGRVPRYFRPPYGEWNPELLAEAARLGLRTVEYDLPSGDPDKNATAEKLIEWVLRKARPGSVVVMHMNRNGWHTAEALPEIIKELRAKGFVLSTVGEMVDASARTTSASGQVR